MAKRERKKKGPPPKGGHRPPAGPRAEHARAETRVRREDDPAWASYGEAFRREVLPRLLSSQVMLSILDGTADDVTIQGATELGYMLLTGKPLILLLRPGATIPEPLRRAAHTIIENYDPSYPESQEALTETIRAVRDTLGMPELEERDGDPEAQA